MPSSLRQCARQYQSYPCQEMSDRLAGPITLTFTPGRRFHRLSQCSNVVGRGPCSDPVTQDDHRQPNLIIQLVAQSACAAISLLCLRRLIATRRDQRSCECELQFELEPRPLIVFLECGEQFERVIQLRGRL